MAKYNVSDAARRAKIARSTMYEKYINTGKISVEKANINGMERTVIDSAEWDRVFGGQSENYNVRTHSQGTDSDVNTVPTDILVKVLGEQLQKAEEREKRLLDQVDRLMRQIEHKPIVVGQSVNVEPPTDNKPQGMTLWKILTTPIRMRGNR